MIERYSRPEMRELWSEARKFQIWLEIETLACEAMADLGQIPRVDAEEIRRRARFSIPEIAEIEKRTNHDVIAFLENVAASVGPAARWMHQGLTSSDILDTTLAVQLTAASRLLAQDLKALREVVAEKARRFKMTPMIGRSHGIHAEPITFGLKLALMFDEFGRAEERLGQTTERIRVGKLSGAVGTHAHLDRRSTGVCEKLGLKAATLSTQIFSAIGTRSFARRSQSSPRASIVGRRSSAICSAPKCSRWRSFSERAKGQLRDAAQGNPITGERLAAWLGLSVLCCHAWRTWRSGTNAILVTPVQSAYPADFLHRWTTCW